MSSFFKFIFVLIFVAQSVTLHAADGSENSNQDVKAVLNQFHNDIEHSELDNESKSKIYSLLNQWVGNFNFTKIALDVHRSAQMRYLQDDGKTEYIKNIPVLASLHLASHFVETVSGPVGVYIASQLGFGSSVQVAIGTVGAIITVPGLDPLCIVLLAISPLKPVQKTMTAIRLVAVKVSGGVSNALQLKQAMGKILEKKDRLSEIINAHPTANLGFVYDAKTDALMKRLVVKSQEGKSYLTLNFNSAKSHNDVVRTWVQSLEVLDVETLNQNKNDLDRLLQRFNISVRYALKQAIYRPRKTFYTADISTTETATNIQFKDYGVVLKPQLGLRTQYQVETSVCKGLFQQ